MTNRKARNPAQAPAKRAPATRFTYEEIEYESPAPFDAASFDPQEFEWRPVPRRPRADGWTPDVQRTFIRALAETGMVEQAAREVDMSVQSAYRLRHAPGSESFARAWTVACKAAADRVLDLAFQRAIEGEEIPIFDRDGCRIGARVKINDRMAMHILRAYMPERFRHAHLGTRQPGEAPPPALPSLAQALEALGPPTPAEPHRLLPPEQLQAMVESARAVAEVEALYPVDEREPYVRPRTEEDHPAATARRRARQRRERDRPIDEDEIDEDDAL